MRSHIMLDEALAIVHTVPYTRVACCTYCSCQSCKTTSAHTRDQCIRPCRKPCHTAHPALGSSTSVFLSRCRQSSMVWRQAPVNQCGKGNVKVPFGRSTTSRGSRPLRACSNKLLGRPTNLIRVGTLARNSTST